ncbi:hypothetical protein ACFLXI_08135 [Chloroflexota bacterium]
MTETPTTVIADNSSLASVTLTPTITSTEDPQKFIQPVLDIFANVLPVFDEDFSTPNEYWNSPVGDDRLNDNLKISNLVSDGVFSLVDEPTEETRYSLTPYMPNNRASDFILQFDFRPQIFNFGTRLNISFRDYYFNILSSGEWVLESDIGTDRLEGYAGFFNMDQPYQFQVTAEGNHLAVVLNDRILAYLEDEVITANYTDLSMSSYKPFQVDIDNIKFWNLDDFDETSAFTEPILAYITNTPPDFEEEFSTPQAYWSGLNDDLKNSHFVADGVLRIVDEPSEETYYPMHFLPDDPFGGFVLQFEFDPLEFGYRSSVWIVFSSDESGDYALSIDSDGIWNFWLLENEGGTALSFGKTSPFLMGQSYQIRLVAKGNQVAAVLNDKILSYVEVDTLQKSPIEISLKSDVPIQAEFDNIKFWNLAGVDLSDQENARLQESQPIGVLDYISEKAPTFEDKFSYGDTSGWLLSQGVNFNTSRPGTMDMEVENDIVYARGDHLTASDFVIQYDFRIEGSDSVSTIFDIRDYMLSFELTGGGEWLVSNDEVVANGVSQNYSPDKWNTVIIFAQGDHFESYLNGELLHAFSESVSGESNRFRAGSASGGQGKVIIDNLKFWNMDGATIEQQITINPEPVITDLLYKKQVFDGSITSLDWSNNLDIGNLIAVAGHDNHVIILNGSTGQERRDPIMGQTEIVSVEWNPDGGGDRLANGDVGGLVSLFRKVQHLGSPEGPNKINSLVGNGEIIDLSFGDIGEGDNGNDLAAATSNGYIAVWNTLGDQGTLAWKIQIDTRSILSLDWNLENHQILTVSENEGIQVWNAATGSRLLRLKYPSQTAVWSPDGKYIAVEDHSTETSAIVVIKSGAEQTLLELPAAANKIAWSPDGKLIAAAGKDGSLWLISGLDDGGQIQSLEILSTYDQDSEVTDLTWSPDSDVILTGDVTGNIWAWQVR